MAEAVIWVDFSLPKDSFDDRHSSVMGLGVMDPPRSSGEEALSTTAARRLAGVVSDVVVVVCPKIEDVPVFARVDGLAERSDTVPALGMS